VFEDCNRSNLLWLADFCALTKRGLYTSAQKKYYSPNYIPLKSGEWHKKGVKKNQVQFPKWSRFSFRPSRYVYPSNFIPSSIPIYRTPKILFAVMDFSSRYILHACLRDAPNTQKGGAFYNWFSLKECMESALKTSESLTKNYPSKPFSLLVDRYALKYHKSDLEGYANSLIGAKHSYEIGRLESFFARITYEMRSPLESIHVMNYIKFQWNNASRFNGKSPLSLYKEGMILDNVPLDRNRGLAWLANNGLLRLIGL
jgi:hypothetical protein